jgi:hypothetical protein
MGEEPHGGPLVELIVLPNRLEADFLVAQLWAQGVRAMVQTSDAEGWAQHLGLVQGTRVMVLQDDLDLACDVLEDMSELDLREDVPHIDEDDTEP